MAAHKLIHGGASQKNSGVNVCCQWGTYEVRSPRTALVTDTIRFQEWASTPLSAAQDPLKWTHDFIQEDRKVHSQAHNPVAAQRGDGAPQGRRLAVRGAWRLAGAGRETGR